MEYNNIKISDVTRALKSAKFRRVDVLECFPGLDEIGIYYKYNGDLCIQAERGITFSIDSLKTYKRFASFGRYHISANNKGGSGCEVATNKESYFYPLLFGYLNGEISAQEIINEVTNE